MKDLKDVRDAEEFVSQLVGSKLYKIDENGFVVLKDGKLKHFKFDDDYGDCCGYNEINAKMLFENGKLSNLNPIITNVELAFNEEGYYDTNSLRIAFLGESKPVAEIKSLSSSGSGWCYGACAWIKCVETEDEYLMTSW